MIDIHQVSHDSDEDNNEDGATMDDDIDNAGLTVTRGKRYWIMVVMLVYTFSECRSQENSINRIKAH